MADLINDSRGIVNVFLRSFLKPKKAGLRVMTISSSHVSNYTSSTRIFGQAWSRAKKYNVLFDFFFKAQEGWATLHPRG